MAVQQITEDLSLPVKTILLGEAEFHGDLDKNTLVKFSERLKAIGFELIDDKKSRLIEKVKTLIIELVHYSEEQPKVNLSDYLADQLHYEYNYLSNLFSQIEGTTIEKYYIAQKIERVKELLVYDELTLNEISYRMGYSSVAHLSSQFKKVTGLTPGHFKNIRSEKRKPLDNL
jgi:AraC-like DNA-binding protein